MIQMKRSPFWMVFVALLTVLSLLGAVGHHHEEDGTLHECSVCRLVQSLSVALLFVAIFLLIQPLKIQNFVFSFQETYQSLLLTVSLKDRAPPVFSF